MEDSRQDLRTEFRAATESSGLAGFGPASAVEGGWKMEEGGWRKKDGGRRTEDEGRRARALSCLRRICPRDVKSSYAPDASSRLPGSGVRCRNQATARSSDLDGP